MTLDSLKGTQRVERSVETPQWLDDGAIHLFNGRILADEQMIIHRSLPIAGTGEVRLLLVLDCPAPQIGACYGKVRCNVADIFAVQYRRSICSWLAMIPSNRTSIP